MTSCRETTRLLSDAADRALTEDERRTIERHLEICPACQRCAAQFVLLRDAMRRLREVRLEG